MFKLILPTAALLLGCLNRTLPGQSFVVSFEQGEQISGQKISGWHDRANMPSLDGVPLGGEGKALRWYQNRTLTAAQPDEDEFGFVEFIGGDRLPGSVIGYASTDVDRDLHEPHLLIDCPQPWTAPNEPLRSNERVFLSFVQRIRWTSKTPRRLTPGTLFFEDGRVLSYRSLRWRSDGVQVLTAEGSLTARFVDLAELHLQRRDHLAGLLNERESWGNSGSLRLEANGGLVATGSKTTFDAMAFANDVDRRQILESIKRTKQKQAKIMSHQAQMERTHNKRLADLDKNVKSRATQFASTKRRMEKSLANRTPQERKAKLKHLEQTMVMRPQQQYVSRKTRLEESRQRNLRRSTQQLASVSTQLEELHSELAASDPTDNPRNWYHQLHPAWSTQPLCVGFSKIRMRLSYASHELPLTRLRPSKVVQHSTLGRGLVWQIDRNVLGESLRSAGREYGWGLGVHADNELHFELPDSARAFRAFVGLDDLVGGGGCAQAAIYLENVNSQPIYQSPILVGSEEVFDTGRLDLTETPEGSQANRRRTLILVVSSLHHDRPANTQPFDILDHVNWLEPLLELER